MKNNWLEEAKKSRRILFDQWTNRGSPEGDFYKWLVNYVDDNLQKRELKEMEEHFKKTAV